MYLICRKNNKPIIVETVKSEKEFGYYSMCGTTVVDLKTNKYLVGTEEDPIHGVISKWEQIPQQYK
jgi:hypothetical protein